MSFFSHDGNRKDAFESRWHDNACALSCQMSDRRCWVVTKTCVFRSPQIYRSLIHNNINQSHQEGQERSFGNQQKASSRAVDQSNTHTKRSIPTNDKETLTHEHRFGFFFFVLNKTKQQTTNNTKT